MNLMLLSRRGTFDFCGYVKQFERADMMVKKGDGWRANSAVHNRRSYLPTTVDPRAVDITTGQDTRKAAPSLDYARLFANGAEPSLAEEGSQYALA